MTRRVLILVEGPTEERFVKSVLAPAFHSRSLYLRPTLLVTKRVKQGANFKGGITTYGKFRNDLQRLLKSDHQALVTTMCDYYGLPQDFPGMANRPPGPALARVTHVEQAIRNDVGSPPNFVPFLALHEFEAWLFSSAEELPRLMSEDGEAFRTICTAFSTPEDIDEGPASAPSKRIAGLFPRYRKPLHGPIAAERIGLARMRAVCPHLNQWLETLESFSTS